MSVENVNGALGSKTTTSASIPGAIAPFVGMPNCFAIAVEVTSTRRFIEMRPSFTPCSHISGRRCWIAARPFGIFEKSYVKPYGMILVTGPTGSGKSTTLYAAVELLRSGREKILTVEDPVEYELAGVPQVPVNEKAGVTFANTLRAMLRQDPDIILVGEIRDAETAQIATQAALTGHLVLSTLHTNDSPTALTRLLDLGGARGEAAEGGEEEGERRPVGLAAEHVLLFDAAGRRLRPRKAQP